MSPPEASPSHPMENMEGFMNLYIDKGLDVAMDSFDSLFCRRCLVFYCRLHGCSQEVVFPVEKHTAWSCQDVEKGPCGPNCHLLAISARSGRCDEKAGNETVDTRTWKPLEIALYEKAIQIFGRNSCLIARNIMSGLKNCSEISKFMNHSGKKILSHENDGMTLANGCLKDDANEIVVSGAHEKKDSNRTKKVLKPRKAVKRESAENKAPLPKRRRVLTTCDQEEKKVPSPGVNEVGNSHDKTPLLIDLNLPGVFPEPENEEQNQAPNREPLNLNPPRVLTTCDQEEKKVPSPGVNEVGNSHDKTPLLIDLNLPGVFPEPESEEQNQAPNREPLNLNPPRVLTTCDQEEKKVPSPGVNEVGNSHDKTPLLIDLNLPGVFPEPENEEQNQAPNREPLNLNPRRLSTRYRPPTMRTMQAFADGYLGLSQKRKRKPKRTCGMDPEVGEGESGSVANGDEVLGE